MIEMKFFLDRLANQYNRAAFLHTDPIQFVHRYKKAEDQEVVGFIAACFSYGSVQLIVRAVQAILVPLGTRPAAAIRKYQGERLWPGFCHRFHKEEHVRVLLLCLRDALNEYGTLEKVFAAQGETMTERLHFFSIWFQNNSERFVRELGLDAPILRGMRFLFSSPRDKSACKRMNMFLRWMIRKDEVDVGLWKNLNKSDLVIPVDTHIARISYFLGLRSGKLEQSTTWKMAEEITGNLGKLDPKDPVLYDFAMTRLGILDICKKKYLESVCERCPVQPVCRFSRKR